MWSRYLCRGKDKDDKNWYEGYYLQQHDVTYGRMPSDNIVEVMRLEKENTHHYIVFERMEDWNLPNGRYRAEVLPETLCQCTGVPDKNGKLIYDKDIVKCGDTIAVVFWNAAYASWRLASMEWACPHFFNAVSAHENYEVIGNIIDNLELRGYVRW